MADKSNLIITMNDYESGKEQQKTITDINPLASSSKLATWGQMTAALSKDGYVKTTRIDKTECDEVTARPITSILYNRNGSPAYTEVPANGVINMTTSEVYANGLRIYITTDYDGQAPIVSDLTDNSDTPIGIEQISWAGAMYGTGNPRNKWGISFTNDVQANLRNITPRTVTFKVKFNPTYQYDAWEKTFTFNITEAGGE